MKTIVRILEQVIACHIVNAAWDLCWAPGDVGIWANNFFERGGGEEKWPDSGPYPEIHGYFYHPSVQSWVLR